MLLALCCLCIIGHTSVSGNLYSRAFWTPIVHGQRLDYCNSSSHVCGMPIANRFCKIMGYESAFNSSIDYNVGYTRHIDNAAICTGWRCHGWKVIRCKSRFQKKITPTRAHIFNFPRMYWARVDYCYTKNHGCGQMAAYAFCRSMSYDHVLSFKKQANALSTCTLGEQRRCFGFKCNGFAQITCTR